VAVIFLGIFYDFWRESVAVKWSPGGEVKLALCCFCDFRRCILPLARDSDSQSGLPGAVVAEFGSGVSLGFLRFLDWQSAVIVIFLDIRLVFCFRTGY
jgi:hypothetical protein